MWDDQDPDLYRAMAAPRPLGAAVSADVEIIEDEDDEYGEDTEDPDAIQTELGFLAMELARRPPRPPSYPHISGLPARIARRLWQHGVDDPTH
ncbi:MAG: hypothetical protein GXP62_14030 [Oligoflexia bacterium]|nr:hypothetical protein [Oligoflexia bacterium]